MASYEELAEEALRNEPGLVPPPNEPFRLTVRPLGVSPPPVNDVNPGEAWGAPNEAGRPSGRLFEPDQTRMPDPTAFNEFSRVNKMGSQPLFLGSESYLADAARGIGSLVSGAADWFGSREMPQRQPPAPGTQPGMRSSISGLPPRNAPPAMPPGSTPAGQFLGQVATETAQIPHNMIEAGRVINDPASTWQQVDQARAQEGQGVAETGMNLWGFNAPFSALRKGASAGVFGGRLSKGFDPNKEKLAELMAQNGQTPQQIWKDTGLVKFADGKWAHEIPDLDAAYAPTSAAKVKMMQGEQLFLPDVIPNHPKLYEAYPELRQLPVSHDAFMHAQGAYAPESVSRGPAGQLDIQQRRIKYREQGKEARGATLDTLLHEIQHAIQQIEGMAKGSGTDPLLSLMKGTGANKYYLEEMQKSPRIWDEKEYFDYYSGQGAAKTKNDYKRYRASAEKDLRSFEENAQFNAAHRAYPESAGENVANLAIDRKDLTPEQAAAIYPPSQFRMPMDQQNVEFNRLINPAGTAPSFPGGPLPTQPRPRRLPEPGQAQMGGILKPRPNELELPQMSERPSPLLPPKGERKATGSLNPLDEMDVTWKGRPMAQWKPQDWKEFGDHYGVKNLGPLSKVERYVSPDGYPFEIPGGTKGTWTYYDLLHMKANPINPHNLPHELHAELQRKLGRTMTPHGEVGQDQIWNGLMFGMTSASNPLFPNQLSASRLRLRDPKMLDALAESIPWKAGETVPKDVRAAKDLEIGQMFNLHEGKSAGSTGLGTRGGVNYTYIAELAQMFRKNPEWFRKKDGEEWIDFVERLGAQTKGLSMKTGSFGSVWQDPYMAAISAIDRHMVKEFERRGGLFLNQAEQEAWQAKTLKFWNKDLPEAERIGSWKELTKQRGFEGFMSEKLLEYVGSHSTKEFRNVKGEINPSLPEHLRKEKWFYEPKQGLQAGEAYKRALAENQKAANEQGLNLFMSQWFEWDRIRQRFEPHENMFPGLSQLPAPSARQLQVPFGAHAETGHTVYDYGPTGRMNPTKKFPRNPSELGYLGVPLAAGGAAGIGSLVKPSYQEDVR